MVVDELLTYFFDGQPHILTEPLSLWLASSRQFVAFATTYRAKIRKKLRSQPDPQSLLDLRLELETAYLLSRERALSLVYEPRQSGQSRRPDFAVSFTTSATFMIEVARLRADQSIAPPQTPDLAPARLAASERLADTICAKLGQMLPGVSNVLLVGVDAAQFTDGDLRSVMQGIQQRAERNDHVWVHRYGFRDRSDFFRHYRRLSELLVRGPGLDPGAPPTVWVNPQATHPLPGKVRTVLYRSHTL